jgi:hypothetical protein
MGTSLRPLGRISTPARARSGVPRLLLINMFSSALDLQGAGPEARVLPVYGVPHGPQPAQHALQPGHQGPVHG